MSEENSNLNTLSGEVELIRSKLFLKKVIDKLPLKVSYYLIGRFKNEERYRYLPFKVNLSSHCTDLLNKRVYVDLLDEDRIRVSLNPEDENAWVNARVNEKISLGGCDFVISKDGHYVEGISMFFVVNSEQTLMNYVESHVAVAPENLSANTIKITFEDYNKYKVQAIVEAISELYIDYSKDQKSRANNQKINFLNEQLKQTEEQLDDYETYFEKFTIENKTADVSRDISVTIGEIIVLDSALYRLRAEKEALLGVANQLSADTMDMRIVAGSTISNEVAKNFEELYELKKELELAEMRYKPESFILQTKQKTFNLLREQIANQLEDQTALVDERIGNTYARKRRLENEFLTLPAKSNELNQKRRFYSLYEELYLSLMQKKTEFEIAQAGTLAEVIILTPANLPDYPTGPSAKVFYLAAIIAGFVLSLIFVGIKYLLYDEINSLSELERLTNTPILGSIAKMRKSAPKDSVAVFDRPRSEVSESFRSIRTGLDFIGLKSHKKVIAVTSTTSGEGKTFASVNLAAILSLSGKKTVILDLDMRKPRAQQAFNLKPTEYGLSTVLVEECSWREALHQTQNDHLHFIPAGPIPPNPAELIDSPAFDKLLAELKDHYDTIIIDTPPIGLVTDGILAIKKSDFSLYIMRSDYSKRSFVKSLERNVEANQLDNIYILFNAAIRAKGDSGYYQEYYNEPRSKSINSIKRFFGLG